MKLLHDDRTTWLDLNNEFSLDRWNNPKKESRQKVDDSSKDYNISRTTKILTVTAPSTHNTRISPIGKKSSKKNNTRDLKILNILFKYRIKAIYLIHISTIYKSHQCYVSDQSSTKWIWVSMAVACKSELVLFIIIWVQDSRV